MLTAHAISELSWLPCDSINPQEFKVVSKYCRKTKGLLQHTGMKVNRKTKKLMINPSKGQGKQGLCLPKYLNKDIYATLQHFAHDQCGIFLLPCIFVICGLCSLCWHYGSVNPGSISMSYTDEQEERKHKKMISIVHKNREYLWL